MAAKATHVEPHSGHIGGSSPSFDAFLKQGIAITGTGTSGMTSTVLSLARCIGNAHKVP